MLTCTLLCALIIFYALPVYSSAVYEESGTGSDLANIVLSLHQDYISRIEKLQKEFEQKFNVQNDRINSLEIELTDQKKFVTKITKQLSLGDRKIEQLQRHVRRLEETIIRQGNPNHSPQSSSAMDNHNDTTNGNGNMTLSKTRSLNPINRKYETHRKGRLLATPNPSISDVTTIAFYAYMSTTLPSAEATTHHVLILDNVRTNVGNAYHPFSGIFIAPETGVYVFSWGFMDGMGSYHSVQLMVNDNELGIVHSHTVSGYDNSAQSTGVVVCAVNKGDDVFLRLYSNVHGELVSNGYGKTFFAGWKLN